MRRVIADLEAISLRAAARRRPRGVGHRAARASTTRSALITELQPRDRALLRGLAVPLRVPQPRLRRLPGLLRLLQAGVPRHLRPRHREDGPGHRGRPVPARRRAAQAGQARGRGRRRTATSGAPRTTRAKDPWFNFSSGNGFYCDDKVWLDHPEIPLGLHPRLHREAAGGREHRPADGRGRRRARPDHERVPRAAAPTTRRAPRSTRSSGCRGSCSRTSRTTTSTSSTGRCRSSGAGSASSAQVLADAGFWADADDIFYVRRDELHAGDLRLRQRLGGRRPRRSARTTGRPRSSAARASSPRSRASRRRRR